MIKWKKGIAKSFKKRYNKRVQQIKNYPLAVYNGDDIMAENRNKKKTSGKKKVKRKFRFNFGVLVMIFVLSYFGCFLLFMTAANLNDDFFKDEFTNTVITPDDDENADEETTDASAPEEETQPTEPVKITNPVPQSQAKDASYLEGCMIITDSTLINIGDYSKFGDVIGNTNLNAKGCNSVKVESSYGIISVYDTIKIKKPDTVYIMLGTDMGESTLDEMISSYTSLVANLHSSLPTMKIYIMQYPPTIYDDGEFTNDRINEYNGRLLELANKAGIYCIDTNTALKGENGALDERFWSYEEHGFSSEGYEETVKYILSHTGS